MTKVAKVYVSRDSVCAGDDGTAPNAREFLLSPSDFSIEHLLRGVFAGAPLPNISGGHATWCLSSAIPLAVIAQEWREPRLLHPIPPQLDEMDIDGATVRLHFSYFAQQDPNTVYEVLRRLRLRSE